MIDIATDINNVMRVYIFLKINTSFIVSIIYLTYAFIALVISIIPLYRANGRQL